MAAGTSATAPARKVSKKGGKGGAQLQMKIDTNNKGSKKTFPGLSRFAIRSSQAFVVPMGDNGSIIA